MVVSTEPQHNHTRDPDVTQPIKRSWEDASRDLLNGQVPPHKSVSKELNNDSHRRNPRGRRKTCGRAEISYDYRAPRPDPPTGGAPEPVSQALNHRPDS